MGIVGGELLGLGLVGGRKRRRRCRPVCRRKTGAFKHCSVKGLAYAKAHRQRVCFPPLMKRMMSRKKRRRTRK